MKPRVNIDPEAPDSGEVIDRGGDFGSWLAERPETFWTLVLVGVVAFVIMGLLKRPFVRGLVVAAVIAIVVIIAIGGN